MVILASRQFVGAERIPGFLELAPNFTSSRTSYYGTLRTSTPLHSFQSPVPASQAVARLPSGAGRRRSIGLGELFEKANQLVFRPEIDLDTAPLALADDADAGAEDETELFLGCPCVNVLRRA